jgi:hypothetical protein
VYKILPKKKQQQKPVVLYEHLKHTTTSTCLEESRLPLVAARYIKKRLQKQTKQDSLKPFNTLTKPNLNPLNKPKPPKPLK